jgi:hypothetical protein
MLSEVLTVTAITATMLSMAMLDVGKAINHARSLSAVTSIAETFALARLTSVRRNVQVVVEVSIEPAPGRRILLRTFEDRNGDFLLDTYMPPAPATTPVSEIILNDFAVDGSYHLWKHGTSKDDVLSSVLFNTYVGNRGLTQRIAFMPDGGIAAPQALDCAAPTSTGGRGLYVADDGGKTFYRITFATTLIGQPRIDRWTAAGYAPTHGDV